MTNKEIEQARKNLCDILNMPNIETKEEQQQFERMEKWLKKYSVNFSPRRGEVNDYIWWGVAKENAHRFLQTEMMLNACVSAKSSCKWAAVAASVAALGLFAAWYASMIKIVVLMLKGI